MHESVHVVAVQRWREQNKRRRTFITGCSDIDIYAMPRGVGEQQQDPQSPSSKSSVSTLKAKSSPSQSYYFMSMTLAYIIPSLLDASSAYETVDHHLLAGPKVAVDAVTDATSTIKTHERACYPSSKSPFTILATRLMAPNFGSHYDPEKTLRQCTTED
jgi:hypothetical protein